MRLHPLPVLLLALAAHQLPALQEGLASWYGGKFHGRTTASGEIFDTNKLTAAHRSLPFGTLVKVTNLGNGRCVVVRINDRGPFVPGRIIDLSRAAATAIGLTGAGVARVRLEPADAGAAQGFQGQAAGFRYAVQLGAFANRDNALALLERLRAGGFPAELERTAAGLYRVSLRRIDEAELPLTLQRLREAGFSHPAVRTDN